MPGTYYLHSPAANLHCASVAFDCRSVFVALRLFDREGVHTVRNTARKIVRRDAVACMRVGCSDLFVPVSTTKNIFGELVRTTDGCPLDLGATVTKTGRS